MQLRILLTVLLLSLTALSYMTSYSVLGVEILILLIAIFSINIGSFARQFITLLILSLSYGFFLLFYAQYTKTTMHDQILFIILHITVTVCMVLIWLTFGLTSRYQAENNALKDKIRTLEKYTGSSNMLTLPEFQSRVKLISTGTQRRKEQNFFVSVSIAPPAGKQETAETLFHVVSEGVLGSIRAEFDLVTHTKPDELLIFLQNTSEDGCGIVITRLMNKLRTQFNLIELPISCEVFKEEDINILIPTVKGEAG
jgi:hypothetical protein